MSAAPPTGRRRIGGLQFPALFLLVTVVSILLHELGHCLLYWIQGIPAGMSLAKEFPLRDISAQEYAIGLVGGPLANLVLLGIAVWSIRRTEPHTLVRRAAGALLLANVFYFLWYSVIAALRREGGELGSVGKLAGWDYRPILVVLVVIAALALLWWASIERIRMTPRTAVALVALLASYVLVVVLLEAVDQRYFWERFPTIQISDGRVYNPHASLLGRAPRGYWVLRPAGEEPLQTTHVFGGLPGGG